MCECHVRVNYGERTKKMYGKVNVTNVLYI